MRQLFCTFFATVLILALFKTATLWQSWVEAEASGHFWVAVGGRSLQLVSLTGADIPAAATPRLPFKFGETSAA